MKRRNFLSAIPVIGSGVLATSCLSQAFAQKGDGEDSPLLVGCTAAMTGPLGGFGIDMKLGVDAAVKQINAKGGINGRPLKYEVLDDGYVPDRAVENARKLIASPKVVALMGCLGTPTNAAITPLIEAAGLPHLAPLTGASSLRKAELKNVFHLRASYTDEITRLVHNLVNMGIRDLAIVYLDNPYGKELAEDAKRALASSGITNPTLVPLALDGKTMAQTVSATLAAKPSAVLLCTAGAATTGQPQEGFAFTAHSRGKRFVYAGRHQNAGQRGPGYWRDHRVPRGQPEQAPRRARLPERHAGY
jgi:branched-chain amino acid transport system substrate-binding protein